VNRVLLVQPQRTGIGSDESSRKHLIGQLGEVALFQRLDKVGADAGLGCDFVDRQTFGLPHLLEKLADRFHAMP
jgi:hypothetical protein